jgi:hypothetical protein
MSEEPKGFTVKDRRHFAPDGSVRREEDPPSAEAPVDEPERPESPSLGEAVDFAGFLVSLASQASVLLGLAAVEGEEPAVDLAGARQMISILEMLQDKTEGRRTPDEDRLLQNLLYELRLAFVQRARGGSA